MDELRKRFDDRNTLRYYGSGNASALGEQSSADTVGKPGDLTPTEAQRAENAQAELRKRFDDRNTDKYYRGQKKAPTKQQIAHQQRQVARQQQQGQRRNGRQSVVEVTALMQGDVIYVPDQGSVRSAVASAIESVRNGGRPTIMVTGEAVLGMSLRTMIDLQMTRATITEDQGRDIAIDLSRVGTAGEVVPETRTADEMFGNPEDVLNAKRDAREDVGDDDAFLGDPGEFLRGETDDDEEKLPDAPAPVAVDDEENDFLAGEPDDAPARITLPADIVTRLPGVPTMGDNSSDFLAKTQPDTGLFNEDEVDADVEAPAARPVPAPK